jgi:hypothetical protein
MAMSASDEEPIVDPREIAARDSNDTTPLFAYVRDKPYVRGCMTSQSRTASAEYQAFLERARNERR